MSAGNLEAVLWSQTSDDIGPPITQTYMVDPATFADPSDVYFEFYYAASASTSWYFNLYSVIVEGINPRVEITPTALDLGEWPIGGWQEAAYLTLQ